MIKVVIVEDQALVDIQMPMLAGLSLTAYLKKNTSLLKIIILTTFDDPTYVANAKALGRHGFFAKICVPGDSRKYHC